MMLSPRSTSSDNAFRDLGGLFQLGLSLAVLVLLFFGLRSIVEDSGIAGLIILLPWIVAWCCQALSIPINCKSLMLLPVMLFMVESYIASGYLVRCRELWIQQAQDYKIARDWGEDVLVATSRKPSVLPQRSTSPTISMPASAVPEVAPGQFSAPTTGPATNQQVNQISPDDLLRSQWPTQSDDSHWPELASTVSSENARQLSEAVEDADVLPWETSNLHHLKHAHLKDGTVPKITNRFLQKYCSPDYEPVPPLPRFFPFYVPPNLMRAHSKELLALEASCHRWTCTFTEEHKQNIWLLWEYLFVLVLFTACFLIPNAFCCLREVAVTSCGAGRCRPWLMWLWISFVIHWGVLLVTLVKNYHYRDVLFYIVNGIAYFLQNTFFTLQIVGFSALLIVAWFNRSKIESYLGIEGLNLVRFGFSDVMEADWRGHAKGGMQVCIWKLTAFQQDMLSPQPRQSLLNALLTGVSRSLGTSADYAPMEHLSTVEGAISEEKTILADRGKPYNLFVRLNLGDNEPRNTLVHYKVQLEERTEIVFNESFKMFFSSEQSDELCVYIRDQGFTSSTELGRVRFNHKDLDALLHTSEQRQRDLNPTASFQGDAAKTQVLAMLEAEEQERYAETLSADEQDRFHRALVDRMKACGFRRYNLNHGGSVWLAFSSLAKEAGGSRTM